MTEPAAPAKLPLKIRIERHLAEYGPIAMAVYFTIFAAVLIGFVIAIRLGFTSAAASSSAMGTVGTWGAAWVATKLTQPLRIVATLALTPIVARALRWFKSRA